MSMVARRRKAVSLTGDVVMDSEPAFSRARMSSMMVAASAAETGMRSGIGTRLIGSGFCAVRVTPFGHGAPAFIQLSSRATSVGSSARPSSGITPSSMGRR